MIFIPGNVPSLKNGKNPVTVKRGGKEFTTLVYSDSVKKYLRNLGIKKYSSKGVEGYKKYPNLFAASVGTFFSGIERFPIVAGFHFVRDSSRRWDFLNAVQIITDLLVAHGHLPDDDVDHLIPVPLICQGRWYSVNDRKPGVYIELVHSFDELVSRRQQQMSLFGT